MQAFITGEPGKAPAWDKLIKVDAQVVSNRRHVTFQMAEVAVSQQMFEDILMLITRVRPPPVLASGALG